MLSVVLVSGIHEEYEFGRLEVFNTQEHDFVVYQHCQRSVVE